MNNRLRQVIVPLVIVLAVLVAGCESSENGDARFTVTVDADGVSRVYNYDQPISVGQFLDEINVSLGDLDEVNPSIYTQLRDGMRITITRVVERTECEQRSLQFETQRQPTQQLAPGEEQIVQVGEPGLIEECFVITEKNGVETSRRQGTSVVVKEPQDQIIFVGSEPLDTLIPVEGTLAFISNGQAYVIEGRTTNLRPITTDGFLDGRVFDLSDSGHQLLYTRSTPDEDDPPFANELWAILDTAERAPESVLLIPDPVLYAEWVAGRQTYTVSYSTATPLSDGSGWRAFNDLYLMPLDPETGEPLSSRIEEVIPQNALGSYAYWGRRYAWSPDGTQLAWALADGAGIYDFEDGEYRTLVSFPEYATLLPVVWVPPLSWSEDAHLILPVHGPPYGGEDPKDSIIFDVAVLGAEDDLVINPFLAQMGIWSNPTYSPVYDDSAGNPAYSIAYFRAREPFNSRGSGYDLWVADSDGSNARLVFPGPDRPGFRAPDPEDGIAWSPSARQIATIYQGNLYIIDVEAGIGYQITSDGQASRPRWSRVR